MMRLSFVWAAVLMACAPKQAGMTTSAVSEAVRPVGELTHADVAFLATQLAQPGTVLIDVRTDEEWAEGHVPGAHHVPLPQVDAAQEFIATLPKDVPVYLICRSGKRSQAAGEILAPQGYRVVSVDGGTLAWIEAGYPIEIPEMATEDANVSPR